MDFKENVKGIIFKICIAFFSLCSLLWFSIFSYGILYYLYIPAVAHIKPVHLQYDMSCSKNKECHPAFPSDNITLAEHGNEVFVTLQAYIRFLRGGQGYAIEIVLEMPESERNLNQGMFMIKLDMIDWYGRTIKCSHRPALLHYRSALFKIFYTLFYMPGLLAGSFEEKQSLTIPLFENYIEESRYPAQFAHVEVQSPFIEIYSSTLRIHAQFTGLRYLMYYWPVLSAVIGIGSHFLFLVVSISLLLIYETTKSPSNNINVGESQSLLQSTRKARKRKTAEAQGKKSQEISSKIEDVKIETLNTTPGLNRIVEDIDEEWFDS